LNFSVKNPVAHKFHDFNDSVSAPITSNYTITINIINPNNNNISVITISTIPISTIHSTICTINITISTINNTIRSIISTITSATSCTSVVAQSATTHWSLKWALQPALRRGAWIGPISIGLEFISSYVLYQLEMQYHHESSGILQLLVVVRLVVDPSINNIAAISRCIAYWSLNN
jgi:hypothetical protein